MKLFSTVLPVSLIIFLMICSISYFTTNHIRSIRKLNENANKFHHIDHEEFLDLNNDETMKTLIQKIRHYESIERAPIKHLGISDLLNENEEKNLRKLSSSNFFDNVGIVGHSDHTPQYFGKWIFSNIKQFESDIMIYPSLLIINMN